MIQVDGDERKLRIQRRQEYIKQLRPIYSQVANKKHWARHRRTHDRNMYKTVSVFYLQLSGVSTSEKLQSSELVALRKKWFIPSKRWHKEYPSTMLFEI